MIGRHPPARTPGARKTLLRLLRKDRVVFDLRGRVSLFGIFILAAAQVLYVDELYLLLGLVLAGSLAVYVPVVEWYQETDSMLHSLPIDRNLVVLARYLAAILAGSLAGVVWNAAGRILLPLLDAGRQDPATWMTFEGSLTFILAVGLMVVLFFPLYFRMGLGRGTVVFLGLSLALLFLAYGTTGIAQGPVGEVHGGPSPVGGFPIVPPSTLVRTRIDALLESAGVAGTLALILAFLGVALFASIKLSQRWLRDREF